MFSRQLSNAASILGMLRGLDISDTKRSEAVHKRRRYHRASKTRATHGSSKYSPRPTVVRNPLVAFDVNANFARWHRARFGQAPAA